MSPDPVLRGGRVGPLGHERRVGCMDSEGGDQVVTVSEVKLVREGGSLPPVFLVLCIDVQNKGE